MQIIADYAPKDRRGGQPIDFSKLDGTKGYLRHYNNYLVLQFFHVHGTHAEKVQAAIELVKCEGALKWWSNLPRYDHQEALRGIERLKREWKGRDPA